MLRLSNGLVMLRLRSSSNATTVLSVRVMLKFGVIDIINAAVVVTSF
jgi:hypothetical protein